MSQRVHWSDCILTVRMHISKTLPKTLIYIIERAPSPPTVKLVRLGYPIKSTLLCWELQFTLLWVTATPSMWVTVFPSSPEKVYLSGQSDRSLIWRLCLIPVETWRKLGDKKKKNILVLRK